MKKAWGKVCRLLLLAVVCYGLYLEIFLGEGIRWGAFLYFTIQSNVLVVLCLLLSFLGVGRGRRYALLQGSALISIVVTGLVYNFVLYRIWLDWGTVGYATSRTIAHLVAPLGFVVVWILFESHGILQRKHCLWLLSHLLLYGLISLVLSWTTGRSLYFFLNASGGLLAIGGILAAMLAGAIFLALVLVGLDQRLARSAYK